MNFLQFNVQRLMGVPVEDMGLVFKGGGGKSTSKSTTDSKPHQQGNYDQLLAGADKWAESGFDKNFGGSEGFDPIAGFTDEQKQALGQMGQTGGDLQNIYGGLGMEGLKDSLGSYDPSKTGLDSALSNMYNQSNFDFDTNQAGQIRQGAQGAGQFGGSRHGIAEGLARGQLAQGQLNTGSQMAMADQQNWNTQRQNTLNNLSAISKGLNSGTATQYDAGALQQGQSQAEIGGDLQKWAYENNVGLNDLLAYQQLISGDMGGTNVTNTTSKGGGGGGGAGMGMLGSFGGSMMGSMGNSFGSSIGGMMG